MKHLYPDIYFHSINELSAEFFHSREITHVIFDIDDTLVAHKVPHATKEVCELFKTLSDAGIVLSLISNAGEDRVTTFNESLPAPLYAIWNAKKPSRRALSSFFENFNVCPAHVAFVGDQLLTDVALCKKWGVFSVLVQPISPFENPFFYAKRAIEKPILRSYFHSVEQINSQKDN